MSRFTRSHVAVFVAYFVSGVGLIVLGIIEVTACLNSYDEPVTEARTVTLDSVTFPYVRVCSTYEMDGKSIRFYDIRSQVPGARSFIDTCTGALGCVATVLTVGGKSCVVFNTNEQTSSLNTQIMRLGILFHYPANFDTETGKVVIPKLTSVNEIRKVQPSVTVELFTSLDRAYDGSSMDEEIRIPFHTLTSLAVQRVAYRPFGSTEKKTEVHVLYKNVEHDIPSIDSGLDALKIPDMYFTSCVKSVQSPGFCSSYVIIDIFFPFITEQIHIEIVTFPWTAILASIGGSLALLRIAFLIIFKNPRTADSILRFGDEDLFRERVGLTRQEFFELMKEASTLGDVMMTTPSSPALGPASPTGSSFATSGADTQLLSPRDQRVSPLSETTSTMISTTPNNGTNGVRGRASSIMKRHSTGNIGSPLTTGGRSSSPKKVSFKSSDIPGRTFSVGGRASPPRRVPTHSDL